ncbi:hypothetical protein L484_025375 [Morus notabilis]|uniref:Uncharacterized protein n=1 Tax=Morus notabilis TaxID=981085 RepID=W9R270_9ROSA|nr:hypothetical protein L484_025375 [Morus notabilis]
MSVGISVRYFGDYCCAIVRRILRESWLDTDFVVRYLRCLHEDTSYAPRDSSVSKSPSRAPSVRCSSDDYLAKNGRRRSGAGLTCVHTSENRSVHGALNSVKHSMISRLGERQMSARILDLTPPFQFTLSKSRKTSSADVYSRSNLRSSWTLPPLLKVRKACSRATCVPPE